MNDISNIKRFVGKLYWVRPNIKTIPNYSKLEDLAFAEVSRAIMNDKIFTISWISRDVQPGLIKLQTTDYINYRGVFSYTDENDFSGSINCTYYENSQGAILIGNELERGYDSTFLAVLNKIDRFEDDIIKQKL